MKPKLISLGISVFLSLSLLSLLFFGCGKGETTPAVKTVAAPKIPVEVLVIHPQLLENKIFTTGTLLANEEVELHPETSGRVTGVFFEEGKRIKKGELMVKINDAELQAQLKAKEPEEQQAIDQERRQRGLFDMKAISQQEYDNAANALKMVQAEEEAIKSQIAETEIHAPFDGIVGLRYVSAGDFASPSLQVATIQDVDPIKAEFSVPEKYAPKLKEGIKVIVRVGDLEDQHIGVVYAVEAKIDPETRTIKARAKVPNADRALIPGSFAKVEITLEQLPNAIVIPSGSIIPELNGAKVFVYQDGKAKAIPITTGIRTDKNIQIIDGLTSNDTLIVTGLLQVGDGKGVQITNLKSD